MAFNLHQLKDSNVQLNKTSVNNHKCNNIARSYKEDTGVIGMQWQVGFCKQVHFELLPEGGNTYCTVYIIKKVIPNLGSIKSNTMVKVFERSERRNCQILMIRVTVPGTVGATAQRQGRTKIARRTSV